MAKPPTERPVVYHGIRILPMPGKRSKLATKIRDGFREQAAQRRALENKP